MTPLCHKECCPLLVTLVVLTGTLATATEPDTPQEKAGTTSKENVSLAHVFTWLDGQLDRLEEVAGYSCTLVMRERVDEKLAEYKYIYMEMRRQPRSVYLYLLKPASLRGAEALFVDGQIHLHLHSGLWKDLYVNPNPLLLQGWRNPLLRFDITTALRETTEHIRRAEEEGRDCRAKQYKGAKINGRPCTVVEVDYRLQKRHFKVRIFEDDALEIPTRFVFFEYPDVGDDKPQVLEEYTYLNVKTNKGFTDSDFESLIQRFQIQPKTVRAQPKPETPREDAPRRVSPDISSAIRKES